MWSFSNTNYMCSLNNNYPDRSNVNYTGPSYYEFTSKDLIYSDAVNSCLRNYSKLL